MSCRRNWLLSLSTSAHSSGSRLRTRYLAKLLNSEFSLQTLIKQKHVMGLKTFSWRVSRQLVAIGMHCLWLLQRLTIVLYLNELCITLSSFISYACQVGISFLTIFANNFAVIVGVFPEKEKILIVKCG